MDKAVFPYLLFFIAILIPGLFMQSAFGIILIAIGAAGFLFTAYFFRDPKRKIPDDANAIVSPADGKVIAIDTVNDAQIANAKRISIFMSPFNVHINRAPFDGEVLEIQHIPGGFKKAFLPEASLENERVEMLLSTPLGKMRIKQIAGIIARRIVCRAKVGDKLTKGQKYGLIHFGSRVEIIFLKNVEVVAKPNQIVLGGETLLAKWNI